MWYFAASSRNILPSSFQICGVTLPYNTLSATRSRMAEISPNLTRYGNKEAANFFKTALSLAQVMRLVISYPFRYTATFYAQRGVWLTAKPPLLVVLYSAFRNQRISWRAIHSQWTWRAYPISTWLIAYHEPPEPWLSVYKLPKPVKHHLIHDSWCLWESCIRYWHAMCCLWFCAFYFESTFSMY